MLWYACQVIVIKANSSKHWKALSNLATTTWRFYVSSAWAGFGNRGRKSKRKFLQMRIMGRWKRNAFEWTKSKHGTKRTQKERKFTLEVHPNRICEYYMIGEAICNMTCPCPAPHLPSVKVHLIEQHDVPVWLLEHWPDMAMQVALATLTQSGGVQHATAVQPGVFRVFSPGAVVRKKSAM